jgi:hypothetical protein
MFLYERTIGASNVRLMTQLGPALSSTACRNGIIQQTT